MKRLTIGLVAAIPEESRHLLAMAGSVTKEYRDIFVLYRFKVRLTDICLITSGIGPARGADAVRVLISWVRPELIINIGFAGGITNSVAVGDLILANRLFSYDGQLLQEKHSLDRSLSDLIETALVAACQGEQFQVLRGGFITCDKILPKRQLTGLLPRAVMNPVLDMESAAEAEAAHEAGVSFLGLRAISDDAGEDLGFSITEFTDSSMNVKVSRVLLTLIRKPRLLPQLIRLAKNSASAGNNLATGIMRLLECLAGDEECQSKLSEKRVAISLFR
jgi:adenosylhomocysteine nucleosidase